MELSKISDFYALHPDAKKHIQSVRLKEFLSKYTNMFKLTVDVSDNIQYCNIIANDANSADIAPNEGVKDIDCEWTRVSRKGNIRDFSGNMDSITASPMPLIKVAEQLIAFIQEKSPKKGGIKYRSLDIKVEETDTKYFML